MREAAADCVREMLEAGVLVSPAPLRAARSFVALWVRQNGGDRREVMREVHSLLGCY